MLSVQQGETKKKWQKINNIFTLVVSYAIWQVVSENGKVQNITPALKRKFCHEIIEYLLDFYAFSIDFLYKLPKELW